MSTTEVSPINMIEARARHYRDAKDVLVERAQSLHDELEGAKRRAMRGLRAAVATLNERQASLHDAIAAHPELFVKPRTLVFHGVKLGYKMAAASIEWEDDAAVVKLIRRHLNDQFDVLVKTTEKPVKAALKNLTPVELKKVGVSVDGTVDVVVIADTTESVDKLVKALMKGAEEEAQS